MLAVNGKCCINIRISYIQKYDAHTAFYHLYDSPWGCGYPCYMYIRMFKCSGDEIAERMPTTTHTINKEEKKNKKAYQMLAVYSQIENPHRNTEL